MNSVVHMHNRFTEKTTVQFVKLSFSTIRIIGYTRDSPIHRRLTHSASHDISLIELLRHWWYGCTFLYSLSQFQVDMSPDTCRLVWGHDRGLHGRLCNPYPVAPNTRLCSAHDSTSSRSPRIHSWLYNKAGRHIATPQGKLKPCNMSKLKLSDGLVEIV